MKGITSRLILGAVLMLTPLATMPAGMAGANAETLSQTSSEVRLYLYFRVPEEAAQRLLPAGWQPAPIASGPAQGANFGLIFIDAMSVQDAQGRPVGSGSNRAVVAFVPARNPSSAAAGPMIILGFSDDPAGAPGAYGVYGPAQVRTERRISVGPGGERRAEETWGVSAAGGDERLELRLRYTASRPSRANLESKVYSARNAEFYRIYRVDQGNDFLRGAGLNRVEELEFRASGARLRTVLDGSEELVGVLSVPWYVRQVFLP